MSDPNIDLYLKPGCPWCSQAVQWLDGEGFVYAAHDVIAEPEKFEEMENLTGQTLAPCLRVRVAEGDDLILPDFGPEELEAFVKQHALTP